MVGDAIFFSSGADTTSLYLEYQNKNIITNRRQHISEVTNKHNFFIDIVKNKYSYVFLKVTYHQHN